MTPELWQRLKPLFAEALQRPPELRDAYVDEACAGDAELHTHLRALLAAEQDATGPLGIQANLEPSLQAALAAFQPGQLILERFRIIRFISGGGMGEVYEADDLLLGKVALKTVRADIADSPDALRRLRQEVQLARRITGPSICRIHEFFLMPADRTHGPAAFISMEYIDGETLACRLTRKGPLPCAEALRIALELCDGLCLIHAQGIIHRDLKPANIMLCGPQGAERTVLMDFGLAHVPHRLSPAASQENLSATDPDPSSILEAGIVGTPAYMAPEQFLGEPVSASTDLYALGIVLYEISTGVQPFSASTPYAAAVHRARRPLPVSSLRRDLPRHWDRIIECCLHYEPSARYQSADAVARALNSGSFTPGNLWQDRRGLVNSAFAVLLCIIAWGALLAWQSLIIYRPAPDAARFYHNGIDALDDGTYLKATHALNAAVERDPRFAMAHVRLAEAWNSLDFQVTAQQELLLASPGEHRLSPVDALQLQAIRSEVTGDFHAAIAARERLLKKLPPDQLSAAYVELGFARERDAQPDAALADYLKAASLDAENASAFLHAGVLQSRLNRTAEGQQSFDRAETIYHTEINQEGLANLHYERGYAANVRGNSEDAKKLLNLSLQEAMEIPSVQLQIRVLQQLSSVSIKDDVNQAKAYATEAIQLARENRLDSWAAIGLVRLSAAQSSQKKYKDARKTIEEGLQLARQTQQIRTEAHANSQLASIEHQSGNFNDVIGPATAARDYYRKNGFFKSAALQSLLIGRAQRDQGRYDEALENAEAMRSLAARSGERQLQSLAEQLIAAIHRDLEDFPAALIHFQRALELDDGKISQQFERIGIANALWHLGRFQEAEEQLRFEPLTEALRENLSEERIRGLMSVFEFSRALQLIRVSSEQNPDMTDDFRNATLPSKAIAEAHLRHMREARQTLALLESEPPGSVAPGQVMLGRAQVEVTLDDLVAGERDAHQAAEWFHQRRLLESELQSVALEAQSARSMGQLSTAVDLEARCVDIIGQISKTWPSNDVKTYLSRPDIKELMRHRP